MKSLVRSILRAAAWCGAATALQAQAPVSPDGAALRFAATHAPTLAEVLVVGQGHTTELSFRLPPGALVSDNVDATAPAIVLDIHGAWSPQGLERGVNAGGIVSVGVVPAGDSAVRLVVRLADLRAYQLRTDSEGVVRVTMDGTGERFSGRAVALVPDERFAVVQQALERKKRPTGGDVVRDPEQITADELTAKKFETWARTAQQRLTARWDRTSLRDALAAISGVSGKSIAAGAGLDSIRVSGDYKELLWTEILSSVARVNGLRLRISDGDIIMVELRSQALADEETMPLEERLIKVVYIRPDSLTAMLKGHLTKRGSITAYGSRGLVLVKDIPDVVNEVHQIIKLMDTPDRGIRVSAMVISIDKSVARDLGIQYDVAKDGLSLGGIVLTSEAASGGTDEATSGASKAVRAAGVAGMAAGLPMPVPGSPAIRAVIQAMAGKYTLGALVSALESKSLGRVVARQSGYVREGQPFFGTSDTETPLRTAAAVGAGAGAGGSGGGAGGASSGVAVGVASVAEIMRTGTTLKVTPTIEPDDVIALDIYVERSSTVPSGLGDSDFQMLRDKYETRARVRNGATRVIGTLEDKTSQTTESGIPYLSRLPGIGRLFRSSAVSGKDRMLVVIVTAQIDD